MFISSSNISSRCLVLSVIDWVLVKWGCNRIICIFVFWFLVGQILDVIRFKDEVCIYVYFLLVCFYKCLMYGEEYEGSCGFFVVEFDDGGVVVCFGLYGYVVVVGCCEFVGDVCCVLDFVV